MWCALDVAIWRVKHWKRSINKTCMSLYINLYPQGIEEITCFLKQQWQHTQRKKRELPFCVEWLVLRLRRWWWVCYGSNTLNQWQLLVNRGSFLLGMWHIRTFSLRLSSYKSHLSVPAKSFCDLCASSHDPKWRNSCSLGQWWMSIHSLPVTCCTLQSTDPPYVSEAAN